MPGLEYRNPLVSQITTAPKTPASLDRDYGNIFSVYNIGGYMEVYNLSDLTYVVPSGTTGNIYYSGNSIPIKFYKSSNTLTDKVFLWNDKISSGRRRLGQLVFVQETQMTYQYTVPDYDSVYTAATAAGAVTYDGQAYYEVINKIGVTPNAAGQALIDVWTGSTIEGVDGVARDDARWRIFHGTDTFLTGGSLNASTGVLSLDLNSGSSVTITGFTTGAIVKRGTFEDSDLVGNVLLINHQCNTEYILYCNIIDPDGTFELSSPKLGDLAGANTSDNIIVDFGAPIGAGTFKWALLAII